MTLSLAPRALAAPYFAAALVAGLFALVVLTTGRAAARRPFIGLLLGVAATLVSAGMVRLAADAETAELLGRFSQAIAGLVPLAGIEFARALAPDPERLWPHRRTIQLALASGALALFTIDTPWVIAGTRASRWGLALTPGPLYAASLLGISTAIVTPLLLYRQYRDPRRAAERGGLRLLVIAGLCAVGGGVDLLPVLGVDVPPLGWVPLTASAALLMWAITRHRLLDARLALGRLGLWLVLTLLSAVPFVGAGMLLLPRLEHRGPWVVAAFALVLMAAIRLWLTTVQPRLEGWLFRRRRSLENELAQLATAMGRLQEPDALGAAIDRFLVALDRRLAALVLLDERGRPYVARSAWGAVPAPTSGAPLLGAMLEARGLVERDRAGAARLEVERACVRWGAEYLGPLVERDELLGIVAVSPRQHGGSADDVELEALSRMCVTVSGGVAGVRLWQRLQALNAELEAKAAARAADLARTVDELRGAEARLVESEKLAALGHLMSGVATDLLRHVESAEAAVAEVQRAAPLLEAAARQVGPETPLLAESGGDLDAILGALREGTRRARAIAGDLARFAPEGDAMLEREEAQLAVLADATLGLVTRHLAGVAIVRDYDESLPPVSVEIGPLEQVILNLVLNAVQAMRGSGTLTLATRRLDGEVELSIGDTGPGIAREVLPHIFEPFFTTKGPAGGTGLGLTVSYGIVERHGGQIRVESELGVGTTFRIRLPMA